MFNILGAPAIIRGRHMPLTATDLQVQVLDYKKGILKRGKRVSFTFPTAAEGWGADPALLLVRRVLTLHFRGGRAADEHFLCCPKPHGPPAFADHGRHLLDAGADTTHHPGPTARRQVHGALRAHPTTSDANRFCVLFVKRGIFACYGQSYGKTGHPTNVANQMCEPSFWWARYKSNRIMWRWFAGGSHFFIGRPYHCRLGRRLCISERFANRICLQLCLNGGQTPKSGRSQTNTLR